MYVCIRINSIGRKLNLIISQVEIELLDKICLCLRITNDCSLYKFGDSGKASLYIDYLEHRCMCGKICVTFFCTMFKFSKLFPLR